MVINNTNRKYTICHPVVFAMVMRDAELCRELLQRILPERKIREIRFRYENDEDDVPQTVMREIYVRDPETEKTIIVGIEAKSIRLDVLFEGDDAWYDLELQIQNLDCPVKRSRYYHAVKAVESFKKGEKYADLKPGYVIFICMFDLFGLNEPLYRFEMREEKNFLPLNDGQVTIFLNGTCSGEIPESLKPFYAYLKNGEVYGDDDMILRMDAAVQEVIQKEEVRYKVTVYDEAMRLNNMLEEAQTKLEASEAALEASAAALEASEAALEASEAALKEAELLNRLNLHLAELNRASDISRAASDEEYRKKLIKEFNLQ